MKIINKLIKCIGLIIVLQAPLIGLQAQEINLDKVVKAGELTLFQELQNEKSYYYLSDKPHIATDENGLPKFSFLRYVENIRSGAAEEEAREGEGEGIVHAVIELSVTDDQLKDAQRELRRIVSDAVIKGPVIYRGGTIALVSSFAKADGELTKQVIGIGKAPIMDGQKAAVSVQLTKKGAEILWESFKTPTPDMSISFEMEVEGYRSPKRAVIEADFEQVYEHKNFQAAVAAPILAAEIKATFDDLVKKGAIKVTQVGEDANLEKIMETAYNKILNMMFDPSGGTGTPSLGSLTSLAGNNASLLDRATTMLGTARTEARTENQRNAGLREEAVKRAREEYDEEMRLRRGNTGQGSEGASASADSSYVPPTEVSHEEASNMERDLESRRQAIREAEESVPQNVTVPSFAVAASFEMKTIRQKGTFKIDLNKYTTDNLSMRFDENFGKINCDECFTQVNLDDALFKQRELVAFVDGANMNDFGNFINFVTVKLKKKHESGEITDDEVRVDRKSFNKEGNNFKLLYGWKGDNNRSEWLDYETKTTWSFFGGHMVEEDWRKSDEGAISLAPPLLSKPINIEADPDIMKDKGIRSAEVKIYYKVGDKEYSKQVRLNMSNNEFSSKIDIIQPRESLDYEYEVMWNIKGEGNKTSVRKNASNAIIFVDDSLN